MTFINLNIYCSRFYIGKIIYFFKITSFKNDFYETEMTNRHKNSNTNTTPLYFIPYFSLFFLFFSSSLPPCLHSLCVSDRRSRFLPRHLSLQLATTSASSCHALSLTVLWPPATVSHLCKSFPIVEDQPPPPLCNYGV